MTGALIRVLIAEDSPTMRRHLASVIAEAPSLQVVGEARNGDEAVTLAASLRPDVISMDIRMPQADGLSATRRIMHENPVPVVVVSGLLEQEVDLSFQALQAGALAVVEKPPARQDPDFQQKQRQLISTLTAMSQVNLVRRWDTGPLTGTVATAPCPQRQDAPEVVVIGASAGGPSALRQLLGGLPENFPLPIVVIQHMPPEFMNGLVRWLDQATPLHVQIASNNLVLERGVVNLAPGGVHLALTRQRGKLMIRLVAEKGAYHHQPAVDVLFQSAAQASGAGSIGILLTGMGDDGAQGLLALRRAGALTIAQDRASSIVYGMPGAAIAQGAAVLEMALPEIATELLKLM